MTTESNLINKLNIIEKKIQASDKVKIILDKFRYFIAKADWLIASKQRAIELGYEPIEAPEAFGGEVFIKNGFK